MGGFEKRKEFNSPEQVLELLSTPHPPSPTPIPHPESEEPGLIRGSKSLVLLALVGVSTQYRP